ncbi:GFA family protein [Alsobacter sp. SYSU M60028]|uniref:GFA family protein n=1 Tax=Alsobacter ponti TaxID=2962936 RepID=A0ABT1LI87_9HYPH|nr:GFA family protein [Alsobacter ponti]MCP8940415.1 GFA family protein [Alsobacter ponti]
MTDLTGGCQCGAVRYRLSMQPYNAHICHCRMCQKAFGNFFAALASVKLDRIAWTRGRPSIYRSSEAAERGFCAACGTPLTFHYLGTDRIAISLGSLDDPTVAPPLKAFGVESKLPFIHTLDGLPGERTDQFASPEDLARMRPRATPP